MPAINPQIAMKEMTAAWYEEQGPASKVLQVGALPFPGPAEGEVLVKLHASGVNPSDVKTRGGTRGAMPYPRVVPHSDGAGVIEAVGPEGDEERIGERVYVYNAAWKRPMGTSATHIVLPASQAVPLPSNVTFEEGACLGIPAMTAHFGVLSDGPVAGKMVLVTGGAGAVGHYAVQLAKWAGATVITTVSGKEKAKAAEAAGADYVINYKLDDVVERVQSITQGEGVDRIVEVEFGGNLEVSQQIIKPYGIIASYGSMADPTPEIPFYALMFNGVTIKPYLVYSMPWAHRLQAVADLTRAMETETLVHNVAEAHPLEDIAKAHRAVESGEVIGNVVVTLPT